MGLDKGMGIAAVWLLFLSGMGPANAQTAARAKYITTYSGDGTNISWITCGSTPTSEGCFESGSLGPFGRACAFLEGSTWNSRNVATRRLYVLDTGKTDGGEVTLHVYKKVDTISTKYITTTITPVTSVALGLTGGATVGCSMAANTVAIFAGTSTSTNAVKIMKHDLSTQALGGWSPPLVVSTITADSAGYVTVNFKTTANSWDEGFILFGPDGSGMEEGGGAQLVPNTLNAIGLE